MNDLCLQCINLMNQYTYMEFAGLWKLEGSDETLKIKETLRTDQYVFEYSDAGKPDERVFIFLSNHRYARLVRSKANERSDVFIMNKDTFLIDDQKFSRVDDGAWVPKTMV